LQLALPPGCNSHHKLLRRRFHASDTSTRDSARQASRFTKVTNAQLCFGAILMLRILANWTRSTRNGFKGQLRTKATLLQKQLPRIALSKNLELVADILAAGHRLPPTIICSVKNNGMCMSQTIYHFGLTLTSLVEKVAVQRSARLDDSCRPFLWCLVEVHPNTTLKARLPRHQILALVFSASFWLSFCQARGVVTALSSGGIKVRSWARG
jgi:hypothetical protein